MRMDPCDAGWVTKEEYGISSTDSCPKQAIISYTGYPVKEMEKRPPDGLQSLRL